MPVSKGAELMKSKAVSTVLFVALAICSTLTFADEPPPGQINYQGVLRNAEGSPLDGQFEMSFGFYGAVCNCCEIQALGCSDEICEGLVCAQDRFCCEVRWDNVCVGLALQFPECVACCTENEILYDDHSGPLSVTVTGGLFNVALGSGLMSDGAGPGLFSSLKNLRYFSYLFLQEAYYLLPSQNTHNQLKL